MNPDGKVSVVVMTKGDKEVPYFLWVTGEAAQVMSPPHSIQTLLF
jgi:glucosylceramidase